MTRRKHKNFNKENFDRFVNDVALQVGKIQAEHRGTRNHEQNLDSQASSKGRRAFHAVRKGKPRMETPMVVNWQRGEKTNDGLREKKKKRDAFEAPLLLKPVCKTKWKEHYIRNGDISDNRTKTNLLEEYRKAKKARFESTMKVYGRVARISHIPSNTHFSVFQVSFCKEKIETNQFADQEADASFISATMFKKYRMEHKRSTQNVLTCQTFTGVSLETSA